MNTHVVEDLKMEIKQLSEILVMKNCQFSNLEKMGKLGFINSIDDDVKKDAESLNIPLNLGQIYTDEMDRLRDEIYSLNNEIANLKRNLESA
ncbi:hypothetical protein [Acinetobacter baumannii]|uniref:hypothetical protein n=1 Tax=Acinetobacter baumannii TaxID=470 RepID=UPI000708293C|nr:hypothetical protein [Acinetobacter baumannii]KQE41670.1 hypothetical protein APD45_15325 [Acinetobacter baumannii]KQE42546.1 hypothetical protein APD45_15210 [Acinetobacter baumannii]MBC6790834.1 hypothetical protein [Acinetobacter baumannii]MBS4736550.1 hypothetical protein [Acinetobacter baumannii]MCH1775280.1 hypothetical protein [Acinetobacter baumannii]